jgi:hypothetical protein
VNVFDPGELTLVRSTKPIAVKVDADGSMTVLEVKDG